MKEKFPAKAQMIMGERFGRDALISLATVEDGNPYVRMVDAYYENGSFFVVTHALSNKMRQIEAHPVVAVCGEWFTARGAGENLGHVCAPHNEAIAEKMRTAFAEWYYNGHVVEKDPNTCILRIRLLDGVLLSQGIRYEIDFTN